MISYVIENTGSRYSIREDGQVEILKSYNKNKIGTFIAKTKNCKINNTLSVCLYFNGKSKTIMVNSLMMKYFNLKPPDNDHIYHLTPKDGDIYNHSLSNLVWKMRLDRKYEYPIDVFYDKQGNITHKRCGCCGDILSYQSFRKHGNRSSARKNICGKCTNRERHKIIQSTKENIDRKYRSARKFLLSEKGRIWYKKHLKNDREKLANWYVNYIIKKTYGVNYTITDDFREVIKLQIQLRREIKFQKQL